MSVATVYIIIYDNGDVQPVQVYVLHVNNTRVCIKFYVILTTIYYIMHREQPHQRETLLYYYYYDLLMVFEQCARLCYSFHRKVLLAARRIHIMVNVTRI